MSVNDLSAIRVLAEQVQAITREFDGTTPLPASHPLAPIYAQVLELQTGIVALKEVIEARYDRMLVSALEEEFKLNGEQGDAP